MPFLPPNQQRQSTEGKSTEASWSVIYTKCLIAPILTSGQRILTKGRITSALVTPTAGESILKLCFHHDMLSPAEKSAAPCCHSICCLHSSMPFSGVTGARQCDHITLVLRQLHWLPVSLRVVFKIAGLVHQSRVPCRRLSPSDTGRRPLRSNSNDMRKLLVPQTHNKLGDRSFSAAGPRLWNDLPPGLRRPGLTFDSFTRSLKTHLFGD